MYPSTKSAAIGAGASSAGFFHAVCEKRLQLRHRRLAYSVALLLLMAAGARPVAAATATEEPFLNLRPINQKQFWVNFGGLSQHFEGAERFNQQNFGFGVEYQTDPTRYVVLGEYQNSVHKNTRYIGGAWMPLKFGIVKLGAIGGAADGYPKMRNGGFFPVVLPVVAIETKHVGANFVIMPSVADKVSGCIALQLKYRFQ